MEILRIGHLNPSPLPRILAFSLNNKLLPQDKGKAQKNIRLPYLESIGISFLDTDYPGPDRVFLSVALSSFCRAKAGTDGHGLGLYCLNN